MMPIHIPAAALYNACLAGDAAAVSSLVPAGGTPVDLSGPRFQTTGTRSTPLMQAAWCGHTSIVRMILERAPNTSVDHPDTTRGTALLLAAQFNHADDVRLLADQGANVNLVGLRGATPLREAVVGPDPDPDPDGERQVATVRALLRLGASTLPPPPQL
jgi:ankyrin repeat protein